MGNFTHDQKAAAVAHAAHAYAKAASQQRPLGSLTNQLLATVSVLIGGGVRRVDEGPLESEQV
jgi:hypothetical protein